MKTVAIIAEYNPFHIGHAYQIQQVKQQLEADYVLVIMSGNFAQRGIPTIYDKSVRTKMALLGGADLVLELPALYALGSAEYFAKGAVSILNALHVTDILHFGSENGNIEQIKEVAQFLTKEPEEYSRILNVHLKNGESFPSARLHAMLDFFQNNSSIKVALSEKELKSLLGESNNILGIEYCKAIFNGKSNIEPYTITRKGAGYLDEELPGESENNSFPSALALRDRIIRKDGFDKLQKYFEPDSFEFLSSVENYPVSANDFSNIMYFKLLEMIKNNENGFFDVKNDFIEKIKNNMNEYTGFEDFCMRLKSKNYTYTKISRSLFHILLGMKQETVDQLVDIGMAQYVRILGFKKEASELLHQIKQKSEIPVISKMADAKKMLSGIALESFEMDIYATQVYNGIVMNYTNQAPNNEFRRQIIIC